MAKDPCAICGGTATIRCNHCGGSGINYRSDLVDDECRGCKGTGQERCRECQGTGEWRGANVLLPTNGQRMGN